MPEKSRTIGTGIRHRCPRYPKPFVEHRERKFFDGGTANSLNRIGEVPIAAVPVGDLNPCLTTARRRPSSKLLTLSRRKTITTSITTCL
jgi:hypothetical protein